MTLAQGQCQLRATREVLRLAATKIKLMAGGGVSSTTDPLHRVQFLLEELKAAVDAAEDWDTYVMVHVYEDAGIFRSIEAGVQCLEHATLMRDKSAKVIKEKDVWVVPYFSTLGLTSEDVQKALGPRAVSKVLRVLSGALNLLKLLMRYDIRKVVFSTDIIGSAEALRKQNKEFGLQLRAWSSHEIPSK